jgi:hypothetical protein
MNLTPDPTEIVQSEEDVPVLQPLPTYVCGPVEVRELPGIRPGYFTVPNVGTAVGIRLLTLEPRRKAAVLVPIDQDIWISTSQAGAQSGAAGAMRIPVNVRFPIDHMDEIWACAVTSTASVGVATTYWSE